MLLLFKVVTVILYFSYFASVECLYEDQIGKIDWRQSYVGHITKVSVDDTSGIPRKLFVASDDGVIASIGMNSGTLLWRQVLEESINVTDAVLCGQYYFTLSGIHLRAWNSKMGNLEAEILVEELESATDSGTLFCDASQRTPYLVVSTLTRIWLYNAQYVTQITSFVNDIGYPLLVTTSGDSLVLMTVKDGSLKSTKLTRKGERSDGGSTKLDGLQSLAKCALSEEYLVCLVDSTLNYYRIDSKLYKKTLSLSKMSPGLGPDTTVSSTSQPNFFIVSSISGATAACLDVTGSDAVSATGRIVTSAYMWEKKSMFSAVVSQEQGQVQVAVYKGCSEKVNTVSFVLPRHHGRVVAAQLSVFTKRDGSFGLRLVLQTEDEALQVINEQGESLWLREEALAGVCAVEFVDLPAADQEELITKETGSILTNFVNRVTHQVQHFVALAKGTVQNQKEQQVTRDEFNLHKLIMVGTRAGKLFALDSISGEIVWHLLVPNAELWSDRQLPLFLQRTSAHFPRPPIATVLYRHRTTKLPLLFSFNPVTGVPVSSQELSHSLLQAFQLPVPSPDTGDLEFTRPLLLLSPQLAVSVFPQGLKLPDLHNIYMYTADQSSNTLQGYRIHLSDSVPVAHQTWRIVFAENITAISAKRSTEHIHSPGRVLGNRHVLYKYMNPNLVAVLTLGLDLVTQGARTGPPFLQLTVNLVDTVSGNIVASGAHPHSSGPIEVVHSEHWLVYSYWNQRQRRFQLTVWELYSPSLRDCLNATHPQVGRQSYILPTPVRRITVTNTEKGITSKALLLALNTGGILELAKAFVDPRRPFEMTPENQEEGLMPYHPEIPISPMAIVNYNQSLPRVVGMHTAPAGLESTSLLFVYGLDLFFTRVQPSKMFDVLKEDFDYFFIATITIGMIVGSFVTQKLAARKALHRSWQ